MNATADLYQAILARHSTRRYRRQPLDERTLAQVRQTLEQTRPLIAENRMQVLMYDAKEDEDLAETMGAYGHIVSAPHYLVPSLVGETRPLADLGYRVEQIAVHLTKLGVSSCYVGTLKQEGAVRRRFDLPTNARIGALLVFGYPATNPIGRALNAAFSLAAGATRKLAPEQIFYRQTFDQSVVPPEHLMPLIEAARCAPSAVNAQPWRLLWHDGALYLFVKRENRRYGKGPAADYRLYDGGICMANITLALEALDRPGTWELLADEDPQLPDHPPSLQPMAKLGQGAPGSGRGGS